MPTLEVKCTVSNCFFHAQGNICAAEKIEIHVHQHMTGKTESEFAADFDAHTTRNKAAHSTDTCCKTFISKKDSAHNLKK